ncbi:hypothetical protein JCM5350_006120 [Sporobolomyces pararoseus]
MFDFRSRTTSNDSASSDQSQAHLSPLPRQLSLRSYKSNSSTIIEGVHGVSQAAEPSLFPRTSENFEGLAELGGATFAELLGRGDMRESIILHAGEIEQEINEAGGGEHERKLQEEEIILTLPGGGWGVVGPDAHLLLQELHRSRISLAQKRRRRISYFAGVTSLAVFAFNLWLLIATVVSIVRFGGRGRGVIRWIEFSIFLATLAFCLVVIAFLRTRRPSTLGMLALVSSTFVASLHVSLALANFILTFVWKDEISISSHSWDVDVAWTDLDGSAGEETRNDFKGWTIAAVVRFFIVVIVAFVWLGSIRLYNRSIHTPFVISPNALPSSELQALLDQHRATIVRLAPSAHPLSAHHSHSPDWLPSHLDRAHYVQASEASAAYSYVSQHMRSSSTAAEGEGEGAGKRLGGVSTWVQAKVWQGVGWMFGVQPYEENSHSQGNEEKVTAECKEEHRSLVKEENPFSANLSKDLDITSFSNDHASLSTTDPVAPTFLTRFFSSATSKRFSTGSTAPLLSTSDPASATIDGEESIPPPPPPKEHCRESRTGSSGSTGGQIVYVRMSDGRLVRRLSTIASLDLSEEVDLTRSSRSDLSGSYQTGESGTDSFATARSRHESGGAEQEVLLDESSRR